LCLTILQTDLSIAAHATILNFYDTATFIHSQTSLQSHVRITTPPAILVYTLLFTSSLCSLSRLCGILALYKRAFEAAMVGRSSSAATAVEPYPRDYVNHFNGFLMDVCNCIWRSRAFTSADPNALGCLIPPSLVGALTTYVSSLDTQLSLTTLFSLSFSPTVCGVSNSYLRELEDKAEDEDDITKRHAGPVTQQSLKTVGLNGGLKLQWADYRLGVLMWMEDRNVKGIGELMYNTMKPLMASREKKQV
jgi:centromere protein I